MAPSDYVLYLAMVLSLFGVYLTLLIWLAST